jgi:hypothetical protein
MLVKNRYWNLLSETVYSVTLREKVNKNVHHLLLRNHTPPCSHIQMWIVHVPNIFAYSIFTLTDSYKPLNIYINTHSPKNNITIEPPICNLYNLKSVQDPVVRSALHQHTDVNVPCTNVTTWMRSNFYIQPNTHKCVYNVSMLMECWSNYRILNGFQVVQIIF